MCATGVARYSRPLSAVATLPDLHRYEHRIAFFSDDAINDEAAAQAQELARLHPGFPRYRDVAKLHDMMSLWDSAYCHTTPTLTDRLQTRLAQLRVAEAAEAARESRLAFFLCDFAQTSACADRAHLARRVLNLRASMEDAAELVAVPVVVAAAPAPVHSHRSLFESDYGHSPIGAAAEAAASSVAMRQEAAARRVDEHLHRVAFGLAAYGNGGSASERAVTAAESIARRSAAALPSSIEIAISRIHDRRSLFENQFAQA